MQGEIMAYDLNARQEQASASDLGSISGPTAEGVCSPCEHVFESDANGIQNRYNHYYGPVHHIGQVTNAAFGPNNGTITQNSNQTPQSDLATLLNPLLDASHTRNRRTSPPNSDCFPGTRARVIEDIYSWAKRGFADEPQHILWVFGYAGCGKSAIAQAVATLLAEKHRLGASFFFFRNAGDRSKISRFAQTIASQIAVAIPRTAPHIEAALQAHPGILNHTTSLTTQLKHLVYDPIRAVSARWYRPMGLWRPFIIVVDGLDECEDKEGASALIKDLVSFFERKPKTPLRFIISSRVEDHLHQRLHNSTQVCFLDLVSLTSDQDIEAALDAAIQDTSGGRVLDACGKEWLSPEDKRELITHIGRSFIFMTTILKVLFAPSAVDGLTPAARLPMVLNMDPGHGAGGPRFDDLYTSILNGSQSLPHFHDVISTIALCPGTLSVAEIADLLDVQIADVVVVLVNLHSIIQVPGDDRTPVTLWHTSLLDFLTSEARSGTFYASPKHYRRLAYRYISLWTSFPLEPPSPASQYALYKAKYYLNLFLQPIKNDTSTLQHEIDQIIAHLEVTFPATFHDVAATYFHLDRFYMNYDNVSLVAYLSPQWEQATMITQILDVIMVKPRECAFQEELLTHMRQSRPRFFDGRHHLEIVMRAIPLLVRINPRTGVLDLDIENRYLFVHWPGHLASAIRAYPQHPAFDAVTPTRVQISQYGSGLSWNAYTISEVTTEQAASNVRLAERAMRTANLSEALRGGGEWNWQRKVYYDLPVFGLDQSDAERLISVYDVFNGIQSFLMCLQSTCAHGRTRKGECVEWSLTQGHATYT